jgi:hypothetical protein
LVFTGKPFGVRFDYGALNLSREGVTISLSGAVPDGVEVVAQLYKRKEQPKPADPSLIAKLGEMLDNTTVGGSNTYGMKFEDVVATILKEFEPVGAPIQKKLSASDKSVAIKATELGEYLLTYQVVATDGEQKLVLAAGGLPMRVEPPVQLAVNSFELEHGKRRFDVDFSMLPELAQVKKVALTVAPVAGGKPVATETTEAAKGFAQFELKSKDWPAAQYLAKAEVLNGTKVLGSAQAQFEKRPVPDWYTKPEGFEPEVPAPWKPVRVSGGGKKIEVLGREYKFKGLPVPASVVSTPARLSQAEPPRKPIELLAAPIELVVTAGGKKLAWRTQQFQVESKKPSEIVLASVNEADGLALKAKTKVEFDGMIRVDFSLEPTKTVLINTLLQRGGSGRAKERNRFSGLGSGQKTAEAVGVRGTTATSAKSRPTPGSTRSSTRISSATAKSASNGSATR